QVEDGSYISFLPKDLVVRSGLPRAALVPALRDIVRRADPGQPVSNVRTMDEIVQAQTAPRAVQSRVIGALAVLAAVLAAIGIHGLLAFAVSQRAQEIGIRIALGARRADILSLILRHSARLAAAGVLPGIALAYAAGRAFQALLAGVRPGDPATFLTAIGLS